MRDLLLERDFDQIATEEILARASVSRGGMYHHFASKVDLFKAAYEASERDAMLRLGAVAEQQAASGAGPFDQLLAACIAYVREARAQGSFSGSACGRAVRCSDGRAGVRLRRRWASRPWGPVSRRLSTPASSQRRRHDHDPPSAIRVDRGGMLAATDPSRNKRWHGSRPRSPACSMACMRRKARMNVSTAREAGAARAALALSGLIRPSEDGNLPRGIRSKETHRHLKVGTTGSLNRANSPLAAFAKPPLTDATTPLAALSWPPLTDAPTPSALLPPPPPTMQRRHSPRCPGRR